MAQSGGNQRDEIAVLLSAQKPKCEICLHHEIRSAVQRNIHYLLDHFDHMQRYLQILLVASFIAFSWLAFMVVHEFGHALTAWLTGGSVSLMILHPLQISWTSFSRNPHPQLVAWGGPA